MQTVTLDLVAQESPRGRRPDLEELRARAGQAWELTHTSSYVELASLLPDLIMDSERATRRLTGEDRTAAFSLLAHVYQATAAAMAKLRQVDVAWVAGDRSIEAAERAGEPLLAAAGVFRIAHAFLSGNRIEEALRTALAAADALEPQVATGPPELIALWERSTGRCRDRHPSERGGHCPGAHAQGGGSGSDSGRIATTSRPSSVLRTLRCMPSPSLWSSGTPARPCGGRHRLMRLGCQSSAAVGSCWTWLVPTLSDGRRPRPSAPSKRPRP